MSILDLHVRLAEVERKISNMMVPGTVEQRDHIKGVRVKLADGDDGPVLSDWINPSDHNTGIRTRVLPNVGSQLMIFTPPGSDSAMAFVPIGHHDNSQNPAAAVGDTVLFEDGTCRISIDGGKVLIKSGNSSILLADGEIKITAPSVKIIGTSLKHNVKEIGDTHKHTGVIPGGGITDIPV